MSTVDASTDPPTIWPRPPVPGTPIEGVAVRALSWKLLLPAASSVSGLRMDAIASCPTTTWSPFEYCARMRPPSASPTRTNCAAADPFCELADGADGCPNWVIRPTPAAVYGFQVMFISAAPSVRPVMLKVIGAPAAGSVNLPRLSKASDPLAPETSNGVPAVPPETSFPDIAT